MQLTLLIFYPSFLCKQVTQSADICYVGGKIWLVVLSLLRRYCSRFDEFACIFNNFFLGITVFPAEQLGKEK